ncbi:Putative tetratricopeptide-like helical domain superfamily, acetyltransferase A, auxiliary subunit [Septoria linicola]|uniref:Tetratricopeptide-like helical domain superfamily, acetyltransferase A, auxiliary subunit n=1 Tax=Septoria linicola TaxID=215465 RepID=A0A9Q9AIZ8_9PEZI|nr:putative tetratricopeptide-like helical domain superfamily, acetyltransferase A, auxiliary subunit [Septoria linicola]USW47813.1 Putative tetratricopeptide-like helical domain superfamily, acetyltransferase A, auxiliary subunit [Septoria linicola]
MAQPLPSKEQTLFRHLVQHYETKQYKKGLKAAEQILKKHPTHGDTQAMKALILNNQSKSDEAFELCKLALKNAMRSHVCWHVYGLLWRSVKNYEEAIKAYRFALRLEPDSVQIQRDLALLQVQMRDYPGYVQSRNQMLQAKPGFRQNWTALAVALHLNGDLEKAEDVLEKFEETLKQPPSKSDMEHAEALLYKNMIIAERGDYKRALEHLESIQKTALDKTAVMESKAAYLLKLDRKDDAEKAYRALLQRNVEKRAYYHGLEQALSLDRNQADDQEKLLALYQSFADKSTRIDAARRIPLDFLHGEAFRQHADQYLRKAFTKGVPSTFANVKQLYADVEKRDTIRDLVESYSHEEPQVNGGAEQHDANGTTNGTSKANTGDRSVSWSLSVNYFLAQHYNYHVSRDLVKAQQYIDKAISLNPQANDYTYQMTRARILKNSGDVTAASKAMNAAREMDLRDRYINTKCAKYQLRNDENQAALSTMGLFTRKEAIGGPLGDLLDMQCMWYITEDGESYLRQGKLSLALKRFKAVYDIFEVWTEDQFDFHTFSLRKGMIRAYVDMIRWEDTLREHPFFTRAALSAVKIYCMLFDRPELANGEHANGGQSEAEKKKAAKKAKKEAEKAEADKKAAAAKKPVPKGEDDEAARKEDKDPQGIELLKQAGEKPLDEAMKYITPLLELSPRNLDAQLAGFEVYIRRKKYLPALRCLRSIQSADPAHPKSEELTSRLKLAVDKDDQPMPAPAKQALTELFSAA